MIEHSTGPWYFSRCDLGHPDNYKNPIVGSGRNYIARLFNNESTIEGCTSRGPSLGEAEANGRLVASAPELLIALEAVVHLLTRTSPECVHAVSAIAKARGSYL